MSASGVDNPDVLTQCQVGRVSRSAPFGFKLGRCESAAERVPEAQPYSRQLLSCDCVRLSTTHPTLDIPTQQARNAAFALSEQVEINYA